jgi:hypothetical protein
MDDIARDVAQGQAHNEYVVGRRREKRAQGEKLHRAGGGFNWTELERGVRAQILQHLQEATRRSVSYEGIIFQNWPVPYNSSSLSRWMSQRIRNTERLPVRFTLSFDLMPASVVDVAPQITVTCSTQLERKHFLKSQETERQETERRRVQDNDREFRELSASELESLCAQMDRTTRWSNVHTIRVIGWPINGPQASPGDQYSFEFVSTDEHGNEVTTSLNTITFHRDRMNSLQQRFRHELRLTHTLVHLATPRRRMVPDYGWRQSEFSRTEAAEWRVIPGLTEKWQSYL